MSASLTHKEVSSNPGCCEYHIWPGAVERLMCLAGPKQRMSLLYGKLNRELELQDSVLVHPFTRVIECIMCKPPGLYAP